LKEKKKSPDNGGLLWLVVGVANGGLHLLQSKLSNIILVYKDS